MMRNVWHYKPYQFNKLKFQKILIFSCALLSPIDIRIFHSYKIGIKHYRWSKFDETIERVASMTQIL